MKRTSETSVKAQKRIWPDLAVVALLAVLCVLFFWRIVTPRATDRASFPQGDFAEQFYAFARYEVEQLTGGHLPLWNPYTFSGHPFLADVQAAVFYPFSLLTILLNAPWGFSLYALEWEAVSHFFLASLFTYLFARRLFRQRWAALISALVFAYGGYLTSYPSQQLAVLEVDVWLPLILLFLEIAASSKARFPNPDSLLWFVLAGLALGVSILAGHPQSSLYVFYACLAYLLFRLIQERAPFVSALLHVAIFLLVGFGLAAVHLGPALEFMRLCTRAQASYLEMSGGFPRQDLLQLLLPGSVSVMSPLYVGILPLLLAIWAVLSMHKRNRQVIFWAILGMLALLLSFGGHTFFYNVFYVFVPGFGLFRSQERAAYLFSFALALLSGYGALSLAHPMTRAVKVCYRGFRRSVAYLFVGALGLVFLFFYGWLEAAWSKDSSFGPLLGRSVLLMLFLLFSLGLFHLRERRLVREGVLLALMSVLVVFDLFSANWRNNLQEVKPEEHWAPTPLAQLPQADGDIFRLYNEWSLPGNYGCVYGLEDVWGASPLRLARYDQFFSALPIERVWQLLNVKYVITHRKVLLPPSEVLYEQPEGESVIYLHRLEEFGPRAYLVHHVEALADDRILERLADPDFDPRRTAILSKDQAQQVPGTSEAPGTLEGEAVRFVERRPGRLWLEVEAASDGLLVLSEVYYPGWQARVDGQETDIYQADYVLRAVPLEAGKHQVEMVYSPLSFKIGLALSGLTLVVAVGLAALAIRRGKGRRQ